MLIALLVILGVGLIVVAVSPRLCWDADGG
jgi:hypothetical protein